MEGTKPPEAGHSIVLAYPYRLIREGIALILRNGGFTVAGQAENLQQLDDLLSRYKPDLLLLDWKILETQAENIKIISENYPTTSVVVLTPPDTSKGFVDALAAGAKGYLSVDLSPNDLLQSLYMLARGRLVVAKEKMQAAEIELRIDKPTSSSQDDLSDREKEVLKLVGKGETNREIAENLVISEHTVKVHLRTILNKLNLRNRQQAAAYATQIGLVKEIKPEEIE